MALTYTPAGDLGSLCPNFKLESVDGRTHETAELFASRPKALVVMFICNHCPYVRAIEDRLLALAREFQPRNIGFVAICSNPGEEYPEDAPAELLRRSREKDYPFPYLVDAEQSVAKAFAAVCTPDLFVYDGQRRLAYRGRLDDSWRHAERVQRRELREALEKVERGEKPSGLQNASMGCSIKWR